MIRRALLAFSLVCGFASAANAACTTGSAIGATLSWVNIKACGAVGDGVADDTAAIQAAIDYAFAHTLTAVYCPAGVYKITSSIYLDPPGNLRVSRTSPSNFAFSMSFFGDPAGSGNYMGCRIRPTFLNDVAFIVGTGQGMRVSDIAIQGGGYYRCTYDPAGVGLGIAGGNGGAAITLIENTEVDGFYTLYATDVFHVGITSESNTFRKVSGANGCKGIVLQGENALVNDIIEPRLLYTTTGIENLWTLPTHVRGGHITQSVNATAVFPISGVSSITGSTGAWTFTATIGLPTYLYPDTTANYIGTPVYGAWIVNTANYGLIPLTMTNWNSGTNTATFQFWLGWEYGNLGFTNLNTLAGLLTDLQAVTSIYASEYGYISRGSGTTVEGVHVENIQACGAVMSVEATHGAARPANELRNMHINTDTSYYYANSNTPYPNLSTYYCQLAFPFLAIGAGGEGDLLLSGGAWTNLQFSTPAARVLIEAPNTDPSMWKIYGDRLTGFYAHTRTNNGGLWGQLGNTDYTGKYFYTQARGFGQWDTDYFLPSGLSSQGVYYMIDGEITAPFCGYEPCPWTTPNLSPTVFSLVCPSATGGASYGAAYSCGALGALGTYPPIASRTVFKSVDWNTGPIGAGIFKRSASAPGYSWGQNLTNTTTGATVTWHYEGRSPVLYLNANTLKFMFPGLGISITDGNGTNTYNVTGVYESLATDVHGGYVTVFSPMAGTDGTVYTCSSSCVISQAPYAWTAY